MTTNPPSDLFPLQTANSRFKQSFSSRFWASMIVATVIHFTILAYFPDLRPADMSVDISEIETIELPPEIEIPPPPDAIARPANPVVTSAEIDAQVTIAPTTFDANPVDNLPPPPADAGVHISDRPTFTPTEVRPEYRNRAEIRRALQREYPATLRDAGIDGRVVMYFLIDEEGMVREFRIGESSEFEAFNDAALRAAGVYRFTPALNQGEPVAVWIQVPITFESR